MFSAQRSQFSHDGKKLLTMASDIGLEPGQWPEMIALDDGQVYSKAKADISGGELFGYIYRSVDAKTMLIIND